MGFLGLSRALGTDMITGIRIAGMESINGDMFARLVRDYKDFGNGDANMIAFWTGWAEMLLNTQPEQKVCDALMALTEGRNDVMPRLKPFVQPQRQPKPLVGGVKKEEPKDVDNAPTVPVPPATSKVSAAPSPPSAAKSSPPLPPPLCASPPPAAAESSQPLASQSHATKAPPAVAPAAVGVKRDRLQMAGVGDDEGDPFASHATDGGSEPGTQQEGPATSTRPKKKARPAIE